VRRLRVAGRSALQIQAFTRAGPRPNAEVRLAKRGLTPRIAWLPARFVYTSPHIYVMMVTLDL
jgi:hypothetical protein